MSKVRSESPTQLEDNPIPSEKGKGKRLSDRFNSVVSSPSLNYWAKSTLAVLNEVAPMCENIPWVGPLAAVTGALIQAVQRVESNKKDVERLARTAADIVLKIIDPFKGCSEEDIDPAQRQSLERDIAQLAETLKKVLVFAENCTNMRKRDKWLRIGTDRQKINDLNSDLSAALASFHVSADVSVRVMAAMNRGGRAKRKSTMITTHSIPPAPLLLAGRDAELAEVVRLLSDDPSSNVCILGPGGMGKTTLSLGILHHNAVIERCGNNRYFVPCDTATSSETLLGVVSTSLGVSNSIDAVMAKLTPVRGPDDKAKETLVVFDNFESPWDTGSYQYEVERLLARFTCMPNVHAIVTMRGDTTPGLTRWAKTSFRQLPQLELEQARKVFAELSDRDPVKEKKEIDALMEELDRMPLAVTLMAQVAKVNMPLKIFLEQWRTKKTALLATRGKDRLSNLDVSIEVSLNSPKMKQFPEALNVLSLLALAPDGIRREDMSGFLAHIPSEKRIEAEVTLVSLSLVVATEDRIRALAPIRAYMIAHHPASVKDLTAIGNYYIQFIKDLGWGELAVDAAVLTPEYGNITTTFLYLLTRDVLGDEVCDHVSDLTSYMRKSLKIHVVLVEECMKYGRRTDRGGQHNYREGWEDETDDEFHNEYDDDDDDDDGDDDDADDNDESTSEDGNKGKLEPSSDAERTQNSPTKEAESSKAEPPPTDSRQSSMFSPNVTYTRKPRPKPSDLPPSERPPFGCIDTYCKRRQVQLAINLAYFYRDLNICGISDIPHTISLFEKAEVLARMAKLPTQLIITLRGNAECQCDQLTYEPAERNLKEALDLCKKHRDRAQEVEVLRCLATVFEKKGEYQRSKETLKDALVICDDYDINEPFYARQSAICLSDLGNVCRLINETAESIVHFEKAMDAFERIGDLHGKNLCLWRQGEAYRRQRNFDKADWCFDEARRMALQNGYQNLIIDCLGSQGQVHYDKRNYNEALDYLEQSWKLRLELNNLLDRGWNNLMLGYCHMALGKGHEKAGIESFKTAIFWYERQEIFGMVGECQGSIKRLEESLQSSSG